jgi:hypothetical protein
LKRREKRALEYGPHTQNKAAVFAAARPSSIQGALL